jgi:hypothetical protein
MFSSHETPFSLSSDRSVRLVSLRVAWFSAYLIRVRDSPAVLEPDQFLEAGAREEDILG